MSAADVAWDLALIHYYRPSIAAQLAVGILVSTKKTVPRHKIAPATQEVHTKPQDVCMLLYHATDPQSSMPQQYLAAV